MTQRRAVVPLIDTNTDAAGCTETEIGGVYSFGGDYFISSFGSGKLSKADVENAARAICELFSIPPDAPLTNNPECTVSALEGQITTVMAVAEAFGLEVEG
ncbi:hypothetical protein [Thalassospira lohafexi]|uniref:Uncharacterized protein n=1 Tax=Thalassospira lohafexi TaxID=744227 RepID=A0A2N3L0W9_9PROT|nr:hypothetical protein [Thalassospira lohafexi]PKR56387.1 hypothetical protein COO92_21520 [Thalassospira lohafexi]